MIDNDTTNKRKTFASSSNANSENSSFENEENKKKQHFYFDDLNQVADQMQLLLAKIEHSDLEISKLKLTHFQLNSAYYGAKSEIIILNQKIKVLEDKNNQLEINCNPDKRVSEVAENLIIEEVKLKLYADVMKMNINNKLDTPIEEIIYIISDNDDEKRRKENNIIIFGLNIVNPADTEMKSIDLLNMIGIATIKPKKFTRLVKKDSVDEYAPIKIELNSINEKFEILKAAKELKRINVTMETKINISQDLTEIERNRQKILINERNRLNDELKKRDNYVNIDYYFGIRRNAVIKIGKAKSQ